MVGAPGIEPGLRVPKTRVLPLYYAPIKKVYHSISSLFKQHNPEMFRDCVAILFYFERKRARLIKP